MPLSIVFLFLNDIIQMFQRMLRLYIYMTRYGQNNTERVRAFRKIMPSMIHSSIKYEPEYKEETQYPLPRFFQLRYFNHSCFVQEQFFRPSTDYLRASKTSGQCNTLRLRGYLQLYWPERVHRWMYIYCHVSHARTVSSCVGGCRFDIYHTNLAGPLKAEYRS